MSQWALVALVEMQIMNPNPEPGQKPELITVEAGTIVNMIAYDGSSPYTPPENTKLESVPDNAKIGDTGY